MPNYRRHYVAHKWFFTVVTAERRPLLTKEPARQCLRSAIEECQAAYPFEIDGFVLLPDHMHCIWSMYETDTNFSNRWSMIKRLFTKCLRDHKGFRAPFWQARFWEHWIRNDVDYENHMNYIHYNPVKHRLVDAPCDWPWSSFHRYVKLGVYLSDWGSGTRIPEDVGNE